MARQIDDICLGGLPLSAEHVTKILCKSGDDGVYPETVKDQFGALIQNPMSIKLERSGSKCAFLDIDLNLTPQRTHTTVYQKRDHMDVFREDSAHGKTAYRRFPHIESKIADSVKYGVFTSQLHRFAGICSTFPAFQHNAVRLMSEMVQHGYVYRRLRHALIQFKAAFLRIQAQVFHRRHATKRTMKQRLMSPIHPRLTNSMRISLLRLDVWIHEQSRHRSASL